MEAAAVTVDVEKEVAIASRPENPFHIKARKEIEEEKQNKNRNLDCNVAIASRLENPSHINASKETKEERQNQNNLDCEGKVWPKVEADGNHASRPCDNSIVSSPSLEACCGGTAEDSCEIRERPGYPSSMQTNEDTAKQLNKEKVKVEDEDFKYLVQPNAEGNGNYASTPCDNIPDSTCSELGCPVQVSYVTSKEPQYCSDNKTNQKVQQSEEQKNLEEDDVKGEVWSKAEEDNRLACKSSDSNAADSTCSEPSCSGGMKGNYGTLAEPENVSDNKIKSTAEQSEKKNSASEDEYCICQVLPKLGKDDSLAPKLCGISLMEPTCPETSCSSATDETTVCSDNPHGSSSFGSRENKGKQDENDSEGHGSSSIESRKNEAGKEGQNDSEGHGSSSIESRKNEAGKEGQNDSEGHGASSIEPRKNEAGKEEENDSEGHGSSSIESRKNEAGKEGQNDSEGHGSSSIESRKNEAGKEEQNDSEGHGASYVEPRKNEAGKEEENDSEGHGSSSIESRKNEAGKEGQNDSEGHGASYVEPRKNEAGKEEENDSEGHGSSSIESRKNEAGKEGQNDSEGHGASSIEPRKNEAGKEEENDNEGHGPSSIERSKNEAGKKDEKDSEGHYSSSRKSRKNEAGNEENDSKGHRSSSNESRRNKSGKEENDKEAHGPSSIETSNNEAGKEEEKDSERCYSSSSESRKNEAGNKEENDSKEHRSSSNESGKNKTGKEEENDSEGLGSFFIEPRISETGKEGQNRSEGHGYSSIEPRKNEAGKEKENDSDRHGYSSIEPRKHKGGKEDNGSESEHGDRKDKHQASVEKPASSSSELCDSQTCFKASSSFEPCGHAVDDYVPSKEHENSSCTETNKEVTEQEEQSEDEEDQGGKCHPNVSKFLHRYIKIGRYMPASISKAGDFRMKESDTVLEAPSLVTPLLVKKPDSFLTENKNCEGKQKQKGVLPLGKVGSSTDDFFGSTVGEFFIGIGLSRAREVYNREQLKLKKHEIKKAGGCAQEMIDDCRRLAEVYQKSRIANAPYNLKVRSCRLCDFKTESSLVLEGHLLTPHLTPRRELQCSFCDFTTRDRQAFVFHVEAMHNRQATVEPPLLLHQCPFCTFETNLKTKAASHVSRCEKLFSIAVNQHLSYDFQPPGVTAKPITLDDVRSYEKILLTLGCGAKGPQKGFCAARSQSGAPALLAPRGRVPLPPKMPRAAPTLNRYHGQARSRLALTQPDYLSNQVFQLVGKGSELIPLHNRSTRQTLALGQAPFNMPNLHTRAPAPVQAQQQTQPQAPKSLEATSPSVSVVVCEICDGYIKDLGHLRLHMHRIHHMVIHRATLSCRPPLNCQKCERRFFTDQGLERHLLGSHGMITPNMQSLAKRSKDAGRCPICGRIYAAKLVSHMSEVHKIALKLATLSYKCTICAAVFGLFEHFENHVRKVHANTTNKSSAAAPKDLPAKRAFSAQASTPTIAQHNSSKRQCLAAASSPTTCQPNSAKRLFSALTSSLASSDTNSAKRPFLASTSSPASANSNSAKRPFLATASTSATANPNSAKQPFLAAASTPGSADLNSVKRPLLAAASTFVSGDSSSAKQQFLGAPSTSVVAKKLTIPATGVPSSEMKQIACLSTKQPLSALATAAAAVTKATSIPTVVSNSKLKESSSMLANPVCKPTVPEIKVEEAVHMKPAPSVPLEIGEPALGWCVACKKGVEDLAEHLKDKHMRQCRVRVCHIEKCDWCLSSFTGLIVVSTSDVEDEDSSEEDEEDYDSEKDDAAGMETVDLDGRGSLPKE
ncbi:uncharacterized protein [Dermacentor albipictus]|uniref:uncharacterized protein n=1 Tax=Dermacentor albipictus TaxID=60249 RepID=UPI0031FD3633